MPFLNHVFISYAHDNNRPLEEGGRGWVEHFHGALDGFLGRRYGKAKIWRDERLRGNEDFSAEIFDQFPDTALMVSVISPSYLKSKWCRDEADKFCEIAQRPPGLVIGNKMRTFKVILDPVESQDQLPAPMRAALGFEFYERDGSRVRELDPELGGEMKAKFLLAVGDLAGEIADLLRRLEGTESAVPAPAAGTDATTAAPAAAAVTGPAVYLAECNYDRREDRKALNAELRARNYRVLPDRELPRDEAEYCAEVARLLEQCVLSIHLVGSVYGSVPDGPSQRAGVVIQNELAVARAHAAGLKRVISLPAGTRSDDAKQQAFINAIHRDPEVQFKAEVITAGLEAVKTAVQTALAPPAPLPQPLAEASGGAASVYVIFDAKDLKDDALIHLRKRLLARGLTLRKPAFDGDAEEVRRTHEHHLAECDAVLIYYGAGTDAWKQSIDRDVEKAKGRSGGRKLRAVFNWIAAPTTRDKDDVVAMGAAANLIDGRDGVTDALVDESIVKVALAEKP
jgi:hypothetical protein